MSLSIVPPTPPEREFLGRIGFKEYYREPVQDQNTGLWTWGVSWRVPDEREAVRAAPGYKIFSADFSQIEVKIMAWLSQDPFLIRAVNSGKDIHCYMASEVFDIPYDEFYAAYKNDGHDKHKEYVAIRSRIKTTTFGIPYGASALRISQMTGMTKEGSQEFIDKYFERACVLKAWLDTLREGAISDGLTRSAKGRLRWYTVPPRGSENYHKVRSQIERYAGNQPIQSTCADMLKMAEDQFYRAIRGCADFFVSRQNNGKVSGDRIYDARVLLAVHDELVGQCPEEDAGTSKQPGPVPQLLVRSMEWAYDQTETVIREWDALENYWIKKTVHLNQLQNRVDVVVDDYWKKG